MQIIDAINNYTAEQYFLSYGDILLKKAKILINTYDYWKDDETYNKDDEVLFKSKKTSYITHLYKSLIDNNFNNLPIYNEKWSLIESFNINDYVTEQEVNIILNLIKISLKSQKSIIVPCLLNKTFSNNEERESYISYLLNLYISSILYNQKYNINYKITNSESLDGASYSASVPNDLQSLQYFSSLNNPFALEILDLISNVCYLSIETVNNTQDDYWNADI